jgi:type IV pilus assembly protein PilE
MKKISNHGFTLIELMITIAIIAILAAIAYPSYQDSVRKTRRAAAQADLLQLSNFMERTFTENNIYNPTSVALPDLGTEQYTVAFDSGEPTATTFVIEATPVAGSGQASDTCGTLSISNTGATGATGSGDCW